MCSEPTSLAVLMAKADKYATVDSAMRIKVTASDKAVPTPAGDGRGGQNNNKRKADQVDSRSNNKLVANMEGEASAPQAGPPRKRSNRNNTNWLPKQSFEQLLDAPARYILGRSRPTTPFGSATSHVGCCKGVAYRLPQLDVVACLLSLPTIVAVVSPPSPSSPPLWVIDKIGKYHDVLDDPRRRVRLPM
ncbi:hypothetical protein D1007_53775 [Hordeum vulgare]|nr:hypothetical protein D1007_53775 [Hordeum vulgare]